METPKSSIYNMEFSFFPICKNPCKTEPALVNGTQENLCMLIDFFPQKNQLVGALVAMNFIFPEILGIIIIPIDELIFFRGVAQPTNQDEATSFLAEVRSRRLGLFRSSWSYPPSKHRHRGHGHWVKMICWYLLYVSVCTVFAALNIVFLFLFA